MFKNFMTHWKTSVNGFLGFLIVTLTTITGFLGSLDFLANATAIHSVGTGLHAISWYTWLTAGLNLLLALCRAWVSYLQKDAGTTDAYLPGNPNPQPVPSAELPLDPRATPVAVVDAAIAAQKQKE